MNDQHQRPRRSFVLIKGGRLVPIETYPERRPFERLRLKLVAGLREHWGSLLLVAGLTAIAWAGVMALRWLARGMGL